MIKLDDIYESREYKSLSDIFDNDDLGIFDNVKPNANNKASNSILEQQFSDINSFIDSHGRLPAKDADTLSEKVLSRQLNSIRSDSSVFKQLDHLDKYGLLIDKEIEPVMKEFVDPYETLKDLLVLEEKIKTGLDELYKML